MVCACLWRNWSRQNADVAGSNPHFMQNRHNRPIGAHFHSGGAKFPYLGEDLYEAFG
jgi:hypothetical protein